MQRSRPTPDQVAGLVDFMESHQSLALGRLTGPDGRQRSKALWAQIARRLNSMGGSIKPDKVWMKYWADKKSSLKKTASLVRASYRKTGGGVDKVPKLTDIDERILAILGDGFGQRDSVMVEPFEDIPSQPPYPLLMPASTTPQPPVLPRQQLAPSPPEPFLPSGINEDQNLDDIQEQNLVEVLVEIHDQENEKENEEPIMEVDHGYQQEPTPVPRRHQEPRQRLRTQLAREKARLIDIEQRRVDAETLRAQNEVSLLNLLRQILEQMANQTAAMERQNVLLQKIAEYFEKGHNSEK